MTEKFLIGTYTKKTSQGIYGVTLDSEQASLSPVWLVAKSEKPAYLQVLNNHLYSVKQIGDEGGVASYALQGDQAELLKTNLSVVAPPAYVAVDQARSLLYSANYHAGTVTVYHINDDQSLTQTDEVKHSGVTGPRPEQDNPHAHYADLTPDHRLVVCDLGLDQTIVYDVSENGQLTFVSTYQHEAGFGTRHLTFSPDGKVAYVLGELSSQLEVLKYDANTGSFEHLQTIKTIPDDWTAHNGAAAIHISSDGKYVYTSNRGENTLAVFAVQADSTVKHIQSISTEGDFPRDFDLSKNEDFLVASNQESDNLTLYDRDPETGLLTLLQKDVACPEPVCVKQW
ncbi:beta-propeller fold lactonase family protein [Limosilactobacillus gastricus]|uniref:6-phosphogluconolactonase n=1 Tax=Limosilactobacillus gastricus DSM 16045 TaxID=1423749 RepID=A0A0R1VC87_9LACO|nr:lactonase family protein [Limosilactobacillus gastricus]KRM02869.1 6-phosphogluconolactonase [Limosilactobacillus gastricus DSM 16045]QGF40793.1 beta-propeller fold lactonase family protein [Limosilactobacillus gastricus]